MKIYGSHNNPNNLIQYSTAQHSGYNCKAHESKIIKLSILFPHRFFIFSSYKIFQFFYLVKEKKKIVPQVKSFSNKRVFLTVFYDFRKNSLQPIKYSNFG